MTYITRVHGNLRGQDTFPDAVFAPILSPAAPRRRLNANITGDWSGHTVFLSYEGSDATDISKVQTKMQINLQH